ncbi:beta-lactamase family protein [Corynebacterium sanguinis]|uniref:serine hydrolase domain-containing protein n=1 Tax=Corynebacterium sanguinis TaxID=2594913 RepID=UPI00223BADA8|nr:serine hydrolase domain-containing protein [Corynebacterium sanguinis]MCT1664213.1 beta-lactamase family protein [Corynebacterium sanguinis]
MKPSSVAAGGLAAIVTLAVMLLLGPRPITLGEETTGDASVSDALRTHADPGHHELAAFYLGNGGVRFGGLGADEHTEFEIGSITKTFNAELLRQQIERGDITLATTVGELIDVPGTPIADVTMEELANHTAGLSSVPAELSSSRLPVVLFHGNPYREATADEIISHAGDAKLKDRGQRNYSNYGHALLGQLLARNANVSYEELLRTSILEPAGMDETYLATSGSGEYSSRGLGLQGRTVEPWDMDGWAPAGAIRSTPADMAKYAQWVADHGRPEYGWSHREIGGTEYTFHNGGTGGFRTMLVWSPDHEAAVFVANTSSMWVDELAVDLLEDLEGTQQQ